MRKSLLIILLFMLVLSIFTGCTEDSESVNEETVETVTEPEVVYYKENDLVNHFIGDLVEKGNYSVDDIRQGQYRSQCVCHLDGYYISIQDDSSLNEGKPTLMIEIQGSDEEDRTESVMNTAIKILKIADPDLSEDIINETIDNLKNVSDDVEGMAIGENIKIDYRPYRDSEDYSAFIQHWMKISVYNYAYE